VQTTLPQMPSTPALQPQATMDRRTVKKKNQAATQILIHWRGSYLQTLLGNMQRKSQLVFHTLTLRTRLFQWEKICHML